MELQPTRAGNNGILAGSDRPQESRWLCYTIYQDYLCPFCEGILGIFKWAIDCFLSCIGMGSKKDYSKDPRWMEVRTQKEAYLRHLLNQKCAELESREGSLQIG